MCWCCRPGSVGVDYVLRFKEVVLETGYTRPLLAETVGTDIYEAATQQSIRNHTVFAGFNITEESVTFDGKVTA